MATAAPSKSEWRWRECATAITLLAATTLGGALVSQAAAAGTCDAGNELAQLQELDRKIADQLSTHDRPAIREALHDVAARASLDSTCSCDSALLNLGLVLSMAVVRLDAAGQSTADAVEAWRTVLDDTLERYQATLDDCAAKQSRKRFASLIKLQLLEKL